MYRGVRRSSGARRRLRSDLPDPVRGGEKELLRHQGDDRILEHRLRVQRLELVVCGLQDDGRALVSTP